MINYVKETTTFIYEAISYGPFKMADQVLCKKIDLYFEDD